MDGMKAVEKNLLEKYPVAVPFAAVAAMLQYRSTAAAYTAKARGTFPVKVDRLGAGLAVRTANMIDYLRGGVRQAPHDYAAKPVRKGVGRPTRVEQVEAQRRGISVRELRSQTSITGV